MNKIEYVCPHCGSNDILHDAWAKWNSDTAAFELVSTFEDKMCGKCEAKFRFLEPAIIPSN